MTPDAAASFSHARQHAKSVSVEPSPEVAKDLNRVTGLHFSKATWGVIWTVLVGGVGWLTNMHINSQTNSAKLDGLTDKLSAIAQGQAKTDATLEKMDGKLERFGERLTRVEIQAGRKHAPPDDGDGGGR